MGQTLLYGLGCIYAGFRLCVNPALFLSDLAPTLAWVEGQLRTRDVHLAPTESLSPSGLALGGLCMLLIGYYHLMAVYTLDEKLKRNSTSGRIIFAALAYFVCFQTPHGSALVALAGAINLVSGLAMGLSLGFGDGN